MSNEIKDDYDEFNVTFEKFEESILKFKIEIKEMIIKNQSDQEIKEVIDNGTKALITMAFNLDKNMVEIGLDLIESTLEQCKDFQIFKKRTSKKGE